MNAHPSQVSRPALDAGGLPHHGARWGDGFALRARSRGPGVPVAVSNPLGSKPRRLLSGPAALQVRAGTLYLTPSLAASGEEFGVVAEY
jgi:hypothetical protein